MAKNSIYDYSTTAGSNTDIAGIGILGTNAVNNFDDAFRTIMAQIATDVSPRRFAIQGDLYGLTLSNNTSDATNGLDIAVGMAATDSTTDPRTMVISSAITKRLDATWAVGTNQGGLDTGAVADNTYHVWLIQRSDTGVVDALFSLSATSPTMPANYDRKRRIGSIIRSGGTILAFTQTGKKFLLTAPFTMRSSTAILAPSLLTAAVPGGIQVEPLLQTRLDWNVSSVANINFGPASTGTATTTVHLVGGSSAGNSLISHYGGFLTNTSQQIYAAQIITAGSLSTGQISNFGWIDTFL